MVNIWTIMYTWIRIYIYIHIHIYVYLKYKYIIYINVCVCTRANNKWPCLWSFYKFLTISNWTEAYIWVHSMGRSPSPQHNPKFNEQKHPHRLSFRGKRIALFIVKLRFVYDSLFNSCPDHRNFFWCVHTHTWCWHNVISAQCWMSIKGYVSAAPCCLGRRSNPPGVHMHGCKEVETSVRLFLSLKLVLIMGKQIGNEVQRHRRFGLIWGKLIVKTWEALSL